MRKVGIQLRTEEEMFALILETAKKDDRIKAVGLTGSRTNSKVPKDSLQDFDVVYVVTDCSAFIENPDWIEVFGQPLIMQRPKEMHLFKEEQAARYTYLMLFEDGNRIDLTLCPVEEAENWHQGDTLAKILLDKENILPELPAASDQIYHAELPSQDYFDDCCNEFWWVSTYVTKGLCRKELFYGADHLYQNCQKEVLRLLTWRTISNKKITWSPGKNYKYLPNEMNAITYKKITQAMDLSSLTSCWNGLLILQELFDEQAQLFSKETGLSYDKVTAAKVISYTEKLKNNFQLRNKRKKHSK